MDAYWAAKNEGGEEEEAEAGAEEAGADAEVQE